MTLEKLRQERNQYVKTLNTIRECSRLLEKELDTQNGWDQVIFEENFAKSLVKNNITGEDNILDAVKSVQIIHPRFFSNVNPYLTYWNASNNKQVRVEPRIWSPIGLSI